MARRYRLPDAKRQDFVEQFSKRLASAYVLPLRRNDPTDKPDLPIAFMHLGIRPSQILRSSVFRIGSGERRWPGLVSSEKACAPVVEAPFLNDRSAWIAFSKGAATVFNEICLALGHPSAKLMSSALRDFARSQEWMAVDE